MTQSGRCQVRAIFMHALSWFIFPVYTGVVRGESSDAKLDAWTVKCSFFLWWHVTNGACLRQGAWKNSGVWSVSALIFFSRKECLVLTLSKDLAVIISLRRSEENARQLIELTVNCLKAKQTIGRILFMKSWRYFDRDTFSTIELQNRHLMRIRNSLKT